MRTDREWATKLCHFELHEFIRANHSLDSVLLRTGIKNFHEWQSFVRRKKKKRKRKYWKSVGIIVGKVEKPIIIIKLNGIVKELIGDYDTDYEKLGEY